MPKRSDTKAILQGLFVTVLWSSSWIIFKQINSEIPPLTFAGLRNILAFIFILPAFLAKNRKSLLEIKAKDWRLILLLGLVGYVLTQGGQFITLSLLDTVTLSLILNFSSPLVAILGFFLLREKVNLQQVIGLLLFLLGSFLYFSEANWQAIHPVGLAFAFFTLFANASTAIIGREVNRSGRVDSLTVTTISMGFGAVILLTLGITIQGLPRLSLQVWLALLWVAGMNTALAFYLWNQVQQKLPAVQTSVINSTMMIQIAILSVIFLGKRLTWLEVLGLVLAAIAVFMVSSKKPEAKPIDE